MKLPPCDHDDHTLLGCGKTNKPPSWLAEAVTVAQIADKLALEMHEISWMRERGRSGKGPYHWRVFWLYLKSWYNLHIRRTIKP